jgi:penicillin-binding protein 2
MLDIPIKDHFRETRIFAQRITVAAAIVVLLSLTLFSRLIYLQIISHSHYETLSQKNRINPIALPPVRGGITDRNGVVLAQNFSVYTLEVIPEQVDDMGQLLKQLAKLITLSPYTIKRFKRLLRERPKFESLLLRTHLTDEEAGRIAVNRPYLNGIELHGRLQRYYPQGASTVHLLGYVGRINDEDLKNIDHGAYRGTNHIGKLGIESSYEPVLLGQVGTRKAEINAHGRILRVVENEPPRAGLNLQLNLDMKLQKTAETALAGRRGAAVAIEPKTGAVLAFASMPVYDPNPFVNGIDVESFQALLKDPDKPLINRAMSGRYAPGSTVKPFLALTALSTGLITRSTSHNCIGWIRLPGDKHRFRDWKRKGHGHTSMRKAIAQSCDVYFYRLAQTLGSERMKLGLEAFGLGMRTNINLNDEPTGLIPTRAWKESIGGSWFPGETIMNGIGQGMMLATPLQLANAVATMANRGLRMQPALIKSYINSSTGKRHETRPVIISRTPTSMEPHFQNIIDDMVAVVHSEIGTARRVGWGAPIAQGAFYDKEAVPEKHRDHALFISFAPADDPKIAVAVVVENGGSGGAVAGPIARKIMDAHLIREDEPKAKSKTGTKEAL